MVTRRAEEITPFLAMEVLERARVMEKKCIDIIHLEVGEPDFDVPQCVKDAACKALSEGHTHYTHSLGSLPLREAICEYYSRTYDVLVCPEQIVVTSGTSPAMLLTFAALLERGDEVILSDPCYACYPNYIRFVEGVPVMVPIYEEEGFQYRPEGLPHCAQRVHPAHPEDAAELLHLRQFRHTDCRDCGPGECGRGCGPDEGHIRRKKTVYGEAPAGDGTGHQGVTPGIDFGENGEGYLRFSYANSIENIAEGMDRLESYLMQTSEGSR